MTELTTQYMGQIFEAEQGVRSFVGDAGRKLAQRRLRRDARRHDASLQMRGRRVAKTKRPKSSSQSFDDVRVESGADAPKWRTKLT